MNIYFLLPDHIKTFPEHLLHIQQCSDQRIVGQRRGVKGKKEKSNGEGAHQQKCSSHPPGILGNKDVPLHHGLVTGRVAGRLLVDCNL